MPPNSFSLKVLMPAAALPGAHARRSRSLRRREAGRDDGELHHLLLEMGTQGAFHRRGDFVAGILTFSSLARRADTDAPCRLDGPWTHDRDLDHEVVVTTWASGAAASTSGRVTRSGRPRRCRRATSSRRHPGPHPAAIPERAACRESHSRARRARLSALKHAEREYIDLSSRDRSGHPVHCNTVRSGIVAFSMGTSSSSSPSEITKPPTCWDR